MAALRRATVMATMLMTVRGFAIGRGALVGPSPQHLASPATPGCIPLPSKTRRAMSLSGGASSTMALRSGRKRDVVITFLKRMLGLMPKAVMPDPALERCSTCFFPTEFHQVPLIGVKTYNYDTKIFTFGLPEDVSLDLPVCACLLVQGYDDAGEPAIRPYTPTSPNEQKGSFDLMVKIYEKGVVSQWLNNLQIGTLVGFKHIPFNIKAQYPFAGKKKINMICGGTGITPMYQALHKIVNTPGDDIEVVLLCGNRTPKDILLREELEAAVAKSSGRVKVVHVVGDKPDMPPIPGWTGEVGWVDEAKVKANCFPPAADVLTMVCGVPGLYDVMCGPRTEGEVKEGSVLARLGYTKDMVAKM